MLSAKVDRVDRCCLLDVACSEVKREVTSFIDRPSSAPGLNFSFGYRGWTFTITQKIELISPSGTLKIGFHFWVPRSLELKLPDLFIFGEG